MASIKVPDLDINRSRGYQYDPKAQKRNSTLFDDLRSMNNSYLSDILNPRQSRLLKPPPRVILPVPIPPPPPPRLLYPPPPLPPPPPPPMVSRIIPPDIKLRQAESIIYGRPRSPPIVNRVVHPPARVYSKPIYGQQPPRIVYSSPIRNHPIPHPPPPHPSPPPHNHPTPPKHQGHNDIVPTVQQNIQPGHHGDHPLPPQPDKHPTNKQEKQIQTDKENHPIIHSKSNFREIIQYKIELLNKLKLDSDPDQPPIDLTPLTEAKDNYIDYSQQLLHKLNDLAQDRKQQMIISKLMNYIKKDPPKQHISWPNY